VSSKGWPRALHTSSQQNSAVISPDGTVRRFSLLDGHQTTGAASVSGLNLPCAAGWADSTPTVPIYDNVTAGTAVLREGSLLTVVEVEPSIAGQVDVLPGLDWFRGGK
jgi:hypothetical protein